MNEYVMCVCYIWMYVCYGYVVVSVLPLGRFLASIFSTISYFPSLSLVQHITILSETRSACPIVSFPFVFFLSSDPLSPPSAGFRYYINLCYVCMLYMHVCYICMLYMLCMYVIYACYLCMYFMYACYLCMYVMYACYVCYIHMLCMYVICVYITYTYSIHVYMYVICVCYVCVLCMYL